jgi:fructoselysine transporter
VHPIKNFPYVSLLFMGGLGFIFSLLFKLTDVITAILTMRIMVQFVGQSVGVLYWHWLKPNEDRPYRMKLFPLPAVVGIIIWLFILFTSPWPFIAGAAGIIAAGILIYFLVIERQKSKQLLAEEKLN